MNDAPPRATASGPRIALLGAFAYPYPQGSQVFFADQARALAAAGARPTLLCYGRGYGEADEELELIRSPAGLSPGVMNSGPQWGKPAADLGLLFTWLGAARRAARAGRPFQFALAHNVEAAAIALMTRRLTRVKTVYVAHTLLRHELSAYLPERFGPEADRAGLQIERSIVRRADGVIALCEETRQALGRHARSEVAVIPPGYAARPPPSAEQRAQTCRGHGLEAGGYTLYSGNLDRYQDLDLLTAATRRLPPSADPVVIASHSQDKRDAGEPLGGPGPGPRRIRVRDFEEMRTLIHGARCLVATRQRIGGFPIKLLNYMEAGRPIVAFTGVAPGLVHDESAWLVEPEQGAKGIAEALTDLSANPDRCERLGAGARRRLETRHPWELIASRTLDYLAAARA